MSGSPPKIHTKFHLVPEEKILQLVYHIWVLRPTFVPLKVCLHQLCNLFMTGSQLKITEIAERLQRLWKGFLEVANQLPNEISRKLSCTKDWPGLKFDREEVA